jgi:hypothetical protein
MDKPLCRLCHQRHWAKEDHVWLNEPKAVNSVNSVNTVNRLREQREQVAVNTVPATDRKAYRRQWMREWRERQRITATSSAAPI